MRSRQLIVVAAACLIAAGCRTDPNTVLLERQLRLQEDEIYRLRACVEDYQEALQAYGGGGTVLSEPAGKSAAPRSNAVTPGIPTMDIVPGRSQTDVPDTLKTGKGRKSTDPMPAPDEPTEKGGEAPPFNTDADPSGTTTPPAGDDSRRVASLVLNRLLCSGYNADGRPGDEGITIMLEPRDAQGRIVKAPANMSVVVLDPALVGESARVARWDFTSSDLAGRFRTGGMEQGLLLQPVWPADGPLHRDLHLFVRYTTHDGRRFEVDRPIQVALAGERSPGWVPREPPADNVQANPSPPKPRIDVSSARIVARPAEPKPQRPVWSPNRL